MSLTEISNKKTKHNEKQSKQKISQQSTAQDKITVCDSKSDWNFKHENEINQTKKQQKDEQENLSQKKLNKRKLN